MALVKKQNSQWDWYYSETSDDKGINKGILTGLDSNATTKSQPSWNMTAWNNTINGANPSSPSTNNATRRTQYAMENLRDYMWNIGSTVPENTRIGNYDTVSPVIQADRWTTSDSDNRNQYTWYIKKINWNSFVTTENEKLFQEVEKSLQEKGIDTTKEVYGSMITDAVNNMLKAEINEWAYKAQLAWIRTQAPNIDLVKTLTKETRMAIAQGKSIKEIAQALGQEERVIQKIAEGKQTELIQLSQQYEDEQMREYLRYREDLDTQMARNITQYQNVKTNLDYQFNSAINTLKTSLFDAEWTARWTAAWLWMTGTSYLLDRIQNQYNNQMMDLQNTYNYQSSNAQIAINNAMEDYAKNVQRYMEDYASKIKEIQWYVRNSFMQSSSDLSLTIDEKLNVLNNLKKNVEEMKANAIITTASALEDWNTALYNYIKNAYWLSDIELQGMWWYYPGTWAEWDLRWKIWTGIANKTNNVWSIKVSATSEALKKLRDEAGIKYTNEWHSNQEWAFWTFETAQDGIKALELALKWRNWNATPKHLKDNGSRAIADLPSNLRNKKINEMTDEEFNQLLWSIIKWENVNAYNLLKSGAWVSTTAMSAEDIKEMELQIGNNNKMLKLVEQFKKEYNEIDVNADIRQYVNTSNINFQEIYRVDWIKTLWQLFNAATNESNTELYNKVRNLIAGSAWLWKFNAAVRTFWQIKNQTFINKLIDAKSKGATFWNLTEWEWERIVTAYNDLTSILNPAEMNSTISELIISLQEANKKLNQWVWNTTVTPDTPKTEQTAKEVNEKINNIINWTWTTATTWTWYSSWTFVNTTFSE